MKQLTLRGFDSQLEKRLETFARSEGISLNRAALEFMRRGGGLPNAKSATPVVGNALDDFIGKWTPKQEHDVLESVRELDKIEKDFWK